jgi:hypothetical protein
MSLPNPVALKQKHLNERREFSLEPNRIRCYTKDLNGEGEAYLDYETLTSTTRKASHQNGTVYIMALSFGVFALIGLALNLAGFSTLMRWAPLWLVASLVLFGFHFYQKRRYFLVDLTTGKSIFFLADKPSREELERFIASMYEARKKYLREQYYQIDLTHEPNAELRKFFWLLKEGIISEIELQEMKESLDMVISSQGQVFPGLGPT